MEATMLFSRFAQSAATLLLLVISLVAPAHAQGNKQIISGTWYEDRANTTFTGTSLTLNFTQTPANQFLNVTNVTCIVIVPSTQSIMMNLNAGTTSGATDLGRPASVMGGATIETSGSLKIYSIVTNQVFYKFGPGRFPSIEITTILSASFTTVANCVIVGNLTDD
jgi:hypothetical protein